MRLRPRFQRGYVAPIVPPVTVTIPVCTSAPVASGTPSIGSTVSCTTGTWTGSPASFGYQWQRDGAAITGATSSSYALVVADYGHSVNCAVTAAGAASPAVSNTIGVVTGAAPVNTIAPAITGTTTVGQVLSCSTGTWTGTATIGYGYQWRRNGTAISGATASNYTLVSADVGQSISCLVTATNVVSSVSQASNTVGSIADTPADSSIPAPTLSLAVGPTTYPPQLNIGLPVEYSVGTHQIRFQGDDDYLIGSPFINDLLVPNDTQATAQAYIDSALASIASGVNFFRARIEWTVGGTTHYSSWSNVQGHGDAVAPTIASSASASSAELIPMAFVVSANEACYFTIGGTDAALLELASSAAASSNTVRLIGNAALNYETKASYSFTITPTDLSGNVGTAQSCTFTVTDVDEAPNSFSFTNQTGATLGATYTTSSITIDGLATGVPVPISISGGSYIKNGGAAATAAGTVQNGDTLALRGVAPGTDGLTTTVVVAVGDPAVSVTWRILTPGAAASITASSSTPAQQASASTHDFTSTNQPAGIPIRAMYSGSIATAYTVNSIGLTKAVPTLSGDVLEVWLGSSPMSAGSYTDHVELLSPSICEIIPASVTGVGFTPSSIARKVAGGSPHQTSSTLTVGTGELGIVFAQTDNAAAAFAADGGGITVTQLAKWTSGGNTFLLGKVTQACTPTISGVTFSTITALTLPPA